MTTFHDVQSPIGHEYNKVKDKQIMLNSLNYTSLGSLFHSLTKKIDAMFDRQEVTIFFSKENQTVLIKRLYVYDVYGCLYSIPKWVNILA